MRVTIFSKFKPYPPTAGGLIRMWTLAKSLKLNGVDVKFVVPVLGSPRTTVHEGIPIYSQNIYDLFNDCIFFCVKFCRHGLV